MFGPYIRWLKTKHLHSSSGGPSRWLPGASVQMHIPTHIHLISNTKNKIFLKETVPEVDLWPTHEQTHTEELLGMRVHTHSCSAHEVWSRRIESWHQRELYKTASSKKKKKYRLTHTYTYRYRACLWIKFLQMWQINQVTVCWQNLYWRDSNSALLNNLCIQINQVKSRWYSAKFDTLILLLTWNFSRSNLYCKEK